MSHHPLLRQISEDECKRSLSWAVRDAHLRHHSVSSSVPSPEVDGFSLVEELEPIHEQAELPFSPTQVSSKVIGVLTSGGDAPGMNAAVRAIAGVCLSYDVPCFAIHNGYAGLMQGEGMIKRLTWESCSDILQQGGTYIGSARSLEFRARPGRLLAAHSLVRHGINSLIAIGGDGTLTGANIFRDEWPSLLDELHDTGKITPQERDRSRYLSVVGLVGSIDNDMSGFSMTIGCDTALQRILYAIDALVTTAASHQRTFIVEVMGRNCGYLAVMAGLACAADWVFTPENPPDAEDWETVVCASLANRRRQGLNYSLVILAEGSTDRVRRPITATYIQKLLSDRLQHDTRITTLGHVQRGGAPSAYDRILATRLGAEAAFAIFAAKETTPPQICGISWNRIVLRDLKDTVQLTKSVALELEARHFQQAAELRGPGFVELMKIYLHTRRMKVITKGTPKRVGILMAGDPASGMNACAMIVARHLINNGHTVFGISESFGGLANGWVQPITWESVSTWMQQGGSVLGTNGVLPSKIEGLDGIAAISAQLKQLNIHGLVAIGGFEAFEGLTELMHNRDRYEGLRIPMLVLPATICNNVPGTDVSVGADTALNFITDAVDRLKQSARSWRRRVFIVETFGGFAGYLAVMGALAGGADDAYTFEEKVHIEDLQATIAHVRRKLQTLPHAVIIRNECCSVNYSTSFVQALFEEEGRASVPPFTTRSNILGHLQEGGTPSAIDRVRASRLASRAGDLIEKEIDLAMQPDGHVETMSDDSCFVVGVNSDKEERRSLRELEAATDFDHFMPKDQWWVRLVPLVRMLENNATRESSPYIPEAIASLTQEA
eukprot:m.67990 g.67990  ORF g.67990 m.67990 type:complete len:838 (-) comp7475_c0_seq2:128-2641(-)